MFFKSSLWKLTELISNGIPKLSSEASKRTYACCHSGQGRFLKGEGVVGIARALLAAGVRFVLVTLWAIDDEATMVFMKRFYQYLKEGKTASAAVQQSMKSHREPEEFSEIRHWSPF